MPGEQRGQRAVTGTAAEHDLDVVLEVHRVPQADRRGIARRDILVPRRGLHLHAHNAEPCAGQVARQRPGGFDLGREGALARHREHRLGPGPPAIQHDERELNAPSRGEQGEFVHAAIGASGQRHVSLELAGERKRRNRNGSH